MSQSQHLYDSAPNPLAGLAVLPARLGTEPELFASPIVVHCLNGKTQYGSFYGIDIEHDQLWVHSERTEDYAVAFDKIRFVMFLQTLNKQRLEQPVAAESIEIIYQDNKKFRVDAAHVMDSKAGLNLFVHKSNRLYRVFVPHQSLKNYAAIEAGSASQLEPLVINLSDFLQYELHEHNIPAAGDKSIQLPKAAAYRAAVISALEQETSVPIVSFGRLLCELGIIDQAQLDNALALQVTHPGQHLGELLKEQRHVDANMISRALAYKLGLPFVELAQFDVDPTALTNIPRELAVQLNIMPLCINKNRLIVAMDDPTNADGIHMAEFVAQKTIDITVAARDDIIVAIDKHYGKQDGVQAYDELKTDSHMAEEVEYQDIKDAEKLSKERPIVRMVNNLLTEAVRSQASDIHIRPGKKSVDIIFRIDSTLVNIRNYSKAIHAAVVSRIKILGKMDISERRIPQDGRAKIHLYHKEIDLRLSIMPTINGESVVIRLLDTSLGLKSLDQIGFEARELQLLKSMLSRNNGIFLVTGPTGSGKSTTLYAGLQYIRESNVNIITAEDPVEYHMDGIEQMQVNHKVGYTFAKILRNILRHDPDVIMVGEVRDQETAKMAIESALTGHLVLSTLHTNSAAVSVARLLEMGVEPYLINDTLLGVLAQRLVRLNCPHCMEQEKVDPFVIETLGVSESEVFHHGRGCDACHGTGYKGRMAVYELLPMSAQLKQHLKPGITADTIESLAIKDGMTPLTNNALNAAREKKISLSEVYRIRLS